MKAERYSASDFGQISKDPYQKWPHGFFSPTKVNELPIFLRKESSFAIARAERALGRVSGLSELVSNPEVLLAPSLMREALSSSRIEGTQASLTDIFVAERSFERVVDPNYSEVLNYLEALIQGTQMLGELPLTSRLIKATHQTLMSGVRGAEKYPGEYRKSPVWIGTPGVGPAQSRFIPPLPEFVPDLIADLERYINSQTEDVTVLRAALAHYQFETIHPFLDGNGRIGRLMISLLFIHDGVLTQPVVNLSSYFEANRAEYYDRMQAVREKGELNEWITFFARGVESQANETGARITALLEIQQRYRAQVTNVRSGLAGLIDLLFQNPILDSPAVSIALGVSLTTATTFLERGEQLGWLIPMSRSGRGGKLRWYAHEIWSATTTEDIEGK